MGKKQFNMKLKGLLFLLLIVALSIVTVSCKKDKVTTDNSNPVNPEDPINVEDPEGTITANLRNDGGSVTVLGTYLVNQNNKFVNGGSNATLSFINIGAVDGLGFIDSIPQGEWSDQINIVPGYGYVVKSGYGINTKYARIFVVSNILDANEIVVGSLIKYQDNWLMAGIQTYDPSNITQSSALCGGIIQGIINVEEHGVCWSTKENPTVRDNHKIAPVDESEFLIDITNLNSSSIYYVRVYAITGQNTYYGEQKSFSTLPFNNCLPYYQNFETSFGTYITKSVVGDQVWDIEYSLARMKGYGQDSSYDNEDWLISSPVEIIGVPNPYMVVEYLGRYFNDINNDIAIYVSNNYQYGNMPETATWIQLQSSLMTSDTWEDFKIAKINLESFIGQTLTFAVKYTSTESNAGILEIKSIYIGESEPEEPEPGIIFSESFSQSQGDFTISNVFLPQELSRVWKFSSSYGMVASAFSNNMSYQSESWLISPSINMNGYSSAILTFDHAANKLTSGTPSQYYIVLVSTDYVDGSPDSAHWTRLNVPNYPEGTNWSVVNSGDVDMSAYLNNSNVHVAFKYTSEYDNSGSWEVKNVLIKENQ